jgi:hypothetical protein
MEKNYNKELDYILEELVSEYENLYKGLKFYTDEASASTKDIVHQKVKDQFGLKDWEINMLFYTLLLDKNLKSIDPLVISMEGLVFRNNGGYMEKFIKENNEKQRIQRIEDDFKKYSFFLMVFTAIVALGTVVSAWFFGIEIWKFYTSWHHPK